MVEKKKETKNVGLN